MTVDGTTNIVPAPKVHLILDVEVDDTKNAVRAQKAAHRVNNGIELGYHAQRVAHGDQLSSSSISILIKVANSLTLGDLFFVFIRLWLVFMQAESTRILADDFDVCPPKAGEALACHFAETRREIHDVYNS